MFKTCHLSADDLVEHLDLMDAKGWDLVAVFPSPVFQASFQVVHKRREFATGAPVPGPTMKMIGELGPETVAVPRDDQSGGEDQ